MTFWRSLSGEVLVELVTADPAGSLAAIAQMGLPIRQVLPVGELTLSFRIRRQDLTQQHPDRLFPVQGNQPHRFFLLPPQIHG